MVAMNWLSREETAALGWTLVHFLWQGAALALAYAVVDRMTRRASSAVRYLVALSALALMPLAVVATFANEISTSSATISLTRGEAAVARIYLTGVANPIAQSSTLAQSASADHQAWLAGHLEPALPWIDGLWLVGVSLLALRALGGWYQLQALRRRSRWTVPADVASQFDQISEQMHLARKISLRISDEVISPLAMGAWRATVILPVSAVLRMPPTELEAVLAHELAHIRRLDYLCNLFQTAVESVLFFHPQSGGSAAPCAIAARSAATRSPYRSAPILSSTPGRCSALEEEKSTRLHLAVALQGSNGSLLRRVKLVLGDVAPPESRSTSGIRVAAAAVLVMGLLFGPKVRKVVAAPVITASQTIFSRAVPALSPASKPQSALTPVKPVPESGSHEWAKVAALPSPAAKVKVDVKVNPSANVLIANEAISLDLSSPESTELFAGKANSQSTGESHSTTAAARLQPKDRRTSLACAPPDTHLTSTTTSTRSSP